LAGITTSLATESRAKVTAHSRSSTTTVTVHHSHAGMKSWMIANPMKAIPVIALSAIGSAILPKLVTRLCLRAMSPSTLSVIIATTNRAQATQRHVVSWPPSCRSAQPKKGTITRRSVVNALGTFQLLTVSGWLIAPPPPQLTRS
jgi:hypothetical protein